MSGTASTSVAVGVGGGAVGYCGDRPPFTAMQWQELEHQAMIYKYLVAGLPIPPDLVMPIRRSFEAVSARFFQYPSLGYCSYYGKKFDPEPGRCRRTDGKKWRCSKDAHPDSKYCERHMHRGRNRSRKPVESQSTSQSLLTATSHISAGKGSNSGSFQSNATGSFQNLPLYAVSNSETLSFGSDMTKLQMEPVSYSISNKEYRYMHGPSDAGEHGFSLETSGTSGGFEVGSNVGSSTWRLTPSQVPTSTLLKQKADCQVPDFSTQLHLPQAFEDVDATASEKRRQQHFFFGTEIASTKQEQHSVHPFFSEWPTTKESWSNLDDDGSNKSAFSTTQLSISIPMPSSEFSSRSACSPNDA